MVAKLNAEPEPASFRFVPNANLIIANLEIKIKKKIHQVPPCPQLTNAYES
jgi:hypothetical protein